jgi:hypothetical protein
VVRVDYRIGKLRDYLFNVINTLTENRKYQINANMLSNNIDNYSLDKIPTSSEIENWIIGGGVHRDVFSFRSRKAYSQDTANNLQNIGFFEDFERVIKTNNDNNILPDIEGIEKIECLNAGTMVRNDDGKTSEFDIQIQITYRQ